MNEPLRRFSRLAVIFSRITILPLAIEALLLAWMLGIAAMEGPGVFDGFGVILLVGIVVFSVHATLAAAVVVFGWLLNRRRALDEPIGPMALWGALAGLCYFMAPALPVILSGDADLVAFVGFCSLFTWPALFFAIYCLLALHNGAAPPRRRKREIRRAAVPSAA
jgi:hypothetical protein